MVTRAEKEKYKAKLRSKAKTKEKKREARRNRDALNYRANPSTLRHVEDIECIQADLDGATLPKANGAWIGKALKSEQEDVVTLDDLKRRGVRIVQWDGR